MMSVERPLFVGPVQSVARRLALIMAVTVTLGGGAASAAPTCFDQTGGVIKCGAPGAMPVGWSPPPEVRAAHIAQDPGPPLGEILEIFCAVGAIFAIIALLPPFDGTQEGDWDP
jgi:hypothetical protein